MNPPIQEGERVCRTVRNLLGDANNVGTVTKVELNAPQLQVHGMRWSVYVQWDDDSLPERLLSETMVTPVDAVTRLAELAP